MSATPPSSADVALVTGAGGDIGAAMAVALAARGCHVVLCEHPSQAVKLAATAQRLRDAGAAVTESCFDVTSRADVERALHTAVAGAGVASLVCNNAGYQGEFARIHESDPADFERVLAVNVTGVYHVLSVAAQLMIAEGRPGAIVNTASMAGVGGAPNMAAYSASKAAVIGLTKTAAKDLAPHAIRVNAISPAFIGPGAMWDRQVALQAAVGSQYYATEPQEVARQMIGMVPLRRYGTLDEVAAVADFLLSDAASYLTGVNIEVSGGSV